ncbi:glutathione s-transferase [Thalassiosira pseudonana CCMP1335]|uniref:glutathione transferase n=1 Tax=Thalassiosira pseudonana TaxID=35128 RepID=B8BXE9_THAPS|nr:glutathione s-transferase [Thalassiosira pseudonana CCMP1335]EED93694.1 glutathione s-transferase [Thalassiosira pseudonana CCMP1335]
MTKPILGYWKIRGLAAGIRYQLAYSKVDFDEDVYEQGDGPDFSRASWMDVKNYQGLEYPNLPYIKDGDVALSESGAIHRYCAKKWAPDLLCLDDAEMYGKTEMAWGVVSDVKGFVTGPCYNGSMTKEELAAASLPRLELLAKSLNSNKFLAGDKVCCADFQFVELLEFVDFVSAGEVYRVYPQLKVYRDRLFGLSGLKEYYEKAEKLPFNNKVAKINN